MAKTLAATIRPLWLTLVGLAVVGHSDVARCDLRESFETPHPSWRLTAETDCELTIVDQRRTSKESFSGQLSEVLRLQCGPGTTAHFAHAVRPARIISEFTASVWIKADRPGTQLKARVVFPNSLDRKGNPIASLISGSLYTRVGSWQQLVVEDTRKRMQQQARVLRQKFGAIDDRGAYIDMIVLNAYSGPGPVAIWIDDLETKAHVTKEVEQPPTAAASERADHRVPGGGDVHAVAPGPTVRLTGSVLEVSGRPVMMRLIEYNGEPLQLLHSMGFNAVKLRAPPTDAELAEARRLGLWLVAPPPHAIGRRQITKDHAPVLAWTLGDDLTAVELESTRALAGEVRQSDDQDGRPLICSPNSHLWEYSRFTNIIETSLLPLGSSFELDQFETWVRNQAALARGGTPFWVGIQTEVAPVLLQQARAVSEGVAPAFVDPEQVRSLAFQAIAAGARGLVFQSDSRLDRGDPVAQLRGATLRLLNTELAALEPWVAGGSAAGRLETLSPYARASVLQTDRSRLLIALRNSPNQQHVAAPVQARTISIVDPGASTSSLVYGFSATSGIAHIKHARRADGMRITFEDGDPVSLAIVTDDPLVRRYFARRTSAGYRQAAILEHEVASRLLAAVSEVAASRIGGAGLPRDVQVAGDSLTRCKSALASGDYVTAHGYYLGAMESLAALRRALWQPAVGGFPSPATSPFCAQFSLLPLHWNLGQRIPQARWQSNVLTGGGFEDLNFLVSRGWQHSRFDDPQVASAVSLVEGDVRSGRSALQLHAWPSDETSKPAQLEAAPVWITSEAVHVRRGQIVRIHGWVKVPRRIESGPDGLMIFDSIGGVQLAQRLQRTDGWQQFTIYRVAPQEGTMTITFALAGLGEALLDDVSVIIGDLPPNVTLSAGR